MQESVNFLREVFADRQPMVYTDTISQFDLHYLKDAIARDTLYNGFFFGQKNAERQLLLTNAEKKYISNQITKQCRFIWPDNFFGDAPKTGSEEKDSAARSNRNPLSLKSIYSFSKPIFIRNNLICIFYYAYYCGGECGQGAVEIYRQINHKWTHWISMVQWIS